MRKNTYYSSSANRADIREYLEHNPLRPEPGAIKIGGSVAIIIGIVLLIISGAFRLWGMA